MYFECKSRAKKDMTVRSCGCISLSAHQTGSDGIWRHFGSVRRPAGGQLLCVARQTKRKNLIHLHKSRLAKCKIGIDSGGKLPSGESRRCMCGTNKLLPLPAKAKELPLRLNLNEIQTFQRERARRDEARK